MNELKVLCFTSSYNRHKMLRGTILDIKNQSYKNIFHTINITADEVLNEDYKLMYDDIESVNIIFTKNSHQHYNFIRAITSVDYNNYDIFVKIDDDDIYKADYVKTIVEYFNMNQTADVVSSKIKYQLNGTILREVNANHLGGNPENCDFKMPPTFAFNKNGLKHILSLDKIYKYEDHMWRDIWCKNCSLHEIDNCNNIIWHIHGKNISTSDFLLK